MRMIGMQSPLRGNRPSVPRMGKCTSEKRPSFHEYIKQQMDPYQDRRDRHDRPPQRCQEQEGSTLCVSQLAVEANTQSKNQRRKRPRPCVQKHVDVRDRVNEGEQPPDKRNRLQKRLEAVARRAAR